METIESITVKLEKSHIEFIENIDGLSETDFMKSDGSKWTAGQQLKHIMVCLVPILKAISNKEFIVQKFGYISRDSWDEETVIKKYKLSLENGGKAPEIFLPDSVMFEDKNSIIEETIKLIEKINEQLNTYSMDELNKLALPHPLLGLLTIAELIYLMSYHAIHHLEQTKLNLNSL